MFALRVEKQPGEIQSSNKLWLTVDKLAIYSSSHPFTSTVLSSAARSVLHSPCTNNFKVNVTFGIGSPNSH